jgi:DNA-directed RNA polymerase subunit F
MMLSGYDLSDSYLSVSYSKAILRSNTKSLSTIACLGDHSMASVYTRSFYYSNQSQAYDTMEDCSQAVKNEECYAAIINSIYAQKLQNEDIRSVYSFTKLSEGSLKIKIAVKHSDDDMVLRPSTRRSLPRARIRSTPSSPAIPIS